MLDSRRLDTDCSQDRFQQKLRLVKGTQSIPGKGGEHLSPSVQMAPVAFLTPMWGSILGSALNAAFCPLGFWVQSLLGLNLEVELRDGLI